MGQLALTTKLSMMIDAMQQAKSMLQRDDIRPARKAELEEEVAVLREDIRLLYIDLFNINVD